MSYRITLTLPERQAIDWVGGRDWNGFELYHCLWIQSSQMPSDADWDDERDITFIVPEHVAWKIQRMWEDNQKCIPHFDGVLTRKLFTFIMNIV